MAKGGTVEMGVSVIVFPGSVNWFDRHTCVSKCHSVQYVGRREPRRAGGTYPTRESLRFCRGTINRTLRHQGRGLLDYWGRNCQRRSDGHSICTCLAPHQRHGHQTGSWSMDFPPMNYGRSRCTCWGRGRHALRMDSWSKGSLPLNSLHSICILP